MSQSTSVKAPATVVASVKMRFSAQKNWLELLTPRSNSRKEDEAEAGIKAPDVESPMTAAC